MNISAEMCEVENEGYDLILPGEMQAKVRNGFFDRCYYDADFGKIFFNKEQDAMDAYVALQFIEIRRYREKIGKLLGISLSEDDAAMGWINEYAAKFSFQWGRLVELACAS